MLTDTVRFWIDIFSTFGWFLLIPLLERVWYIYKQPLLREGLTTDVLCTYQNFVFQLLTLSSQPIVLEGILATSIALHYFPATGDGLLQGTLAHQPLAINLMAIILTGEIAFYTVHYFFHMIPALWEFHRVHHSSVLLDSFSTSRFHIIERLAFSLPNVVAIIYLGARPEAMVIYFFFRSFMDRYIHSNLNGPRWAHKILISSPYFHRWHHATTKEAINKNFSGDFIFMDLIFGTAYDPDPKAIPLPKAFGDPNYSNDFIVQQITPFICLYKRYAKKR